MTAPAAVEETDCTTCLATVPATRFCVRCGSPLTESNGRRGFAASPRERALAPWITSSLFPRLPRSSLVAFKVALAVGLAMVAGVGLASAFPLAIVLAAVLVPALTAVYVVDVHVYEDAPYRVLGMTAAWGIGAGVLVGLATRAVTPDPADLLERSRLESLLVEGAAIPLLGLALAVLGPALLLLDRRFDDALDGVTFGAVAAAWLSASTVLVAASSLLADGLTPGGSVSEWLFRLLVVAANPVLWASAVGAAVGAVWSHFRPPAHGNPTLGPLGNPFLALAFAGSLLVASAAVQLSLPIAWAAPLVLVLACIGLVWLRHSLQTGLLQEAGQVEIGPASTCANCGVEVPHHTFCGACGIANRALPKTRGDGASGSAGARIRAALVPLGVAAGLLVLGGATSATVLALAPSGAVVTCEPGEPCGGPPFEQPLPDGAPWSNDHDVSLVYDQQRWSLDEDGDTRLVLTSPDGSVWVEIQSAREEGAETGSSPTPAELPGRLRAVEPLDVPLHGANVGYVDGAGGWYAGFLDSPQGPRTSATIARLSSRRGDVTVRATAVFFAPSEEVFGNPEGRSRALRGAVDSILNTVRWGRGAATQAAPAPPSKSAVAAPRTATPLGPTSRETVVDLSLTLAYPGKAALVRYASAVNDPQSRLYGRTLSAATIGERFGLPQRVIAHAVSTLERAGLDVVSTTPQRTVLHVRAPAAAVNRFFGVALDDYRGPDGTRFRKPSSPVVVPSPLAEVIDGVVGLDTESPPGAMQPSPRGGLRPGEIARAYGIQELWDAEIHGEGKTVGIVALDSFRDEDIQAYDELMQIEGAPEVERVPVNDETVALGAYAREVSLDIEIVRAVAPQAQIVVFEAPLGWPGFIAALAKINADDRVDVASVSFGKCLAHVEPAVREAMESELEIAVARRKTIFVASGDSGAFSCLHTESELNERSHVRSVDWPAASPHVVAVGGTRLTLGANGSYFAENGWEDVLSNRGTGGGVSTAHRRPSWQRGAGVPNERNRLVPDVAGPADCDSGFLIVYPRLGPNGWEHAEGPGGCGTSAAAPFWAGVAALGLQYAERESGRRFGFLGPVLYDLARGNPRYPPFHDVQTGGNLDQPARRGWDYATGLGSPRAWNLARDLVGRKRGRG